MAKDKLDWFPFKWQRFIIGTLNMSAEEIGAYVLMLIYEWDKGFIPEDPKELRKICKVSFKKLTNVLEKFENINGKLYNETLEIIRIEQSEKLNKNTERAEKGSKARWDKHKLSIAQAQKNDAIREEKIREEKNILEERREEENIPPELNFNYMIEGKEILSVEETFKENFPILLTDLKIKHGELKIKKWMTEFSERHKQKSWKDVQDLRHHISNYIIKASEKNNGATKKHTKQDGSVSDFGSH